MAMLDRARFATVTHFVERDGAAVLLLCGTDWDGGSGWTTYPSVATCPECVSRLARRQAEREREQQLTT